MTRHPWVAASDNGIRWGLQTVVPNRRHALPALLNTARLIEDLGYDSLFVMDHPALHADPYVALSGIAAVTDRLYLGQLVMAAAYRNPALVARMQTDLDNLSNGRSILGLGAGWFATEYHNLGLPFPPAGERQESLDEVLAIISGVWGDDPFTFEGDHFQVHDLQIEPTLSLRPPLLLGGEGEQKTLRRVARIGDACNLREKIPVSAPASRDPERFAEVAHKFGVIDQHCDDLGRPRNEVLRSHFTTYLILAPTQSEADARADAVDTASSTSAGVRSNGREFLFPASPDRAIAYFQGMREIGAEYFVVQVDADDETTIRSLASDVMPAIV